MSAAALAPGLGGEDKILWVAIISGRTLFKNVSQGVNIKVAPVAQVDRAPASGAGCERSSRSRGVFMTTRRLCDS